MRRVESARSAAAVVAVAVAVVAVVADRAVADEGRFQDYAAGARAAGLGGAFGALGDDATGVFYNPAGLADIQTARVSVSTSLYGLELHGATPVESALLRLERGVTPSDLIIVPSSTGVVFGAGERLASGTYRRAFAFATIVPQYTSRFLESVALDESGAELRSALTDRTLHAGAGWGEHVGPWLRVGLALHYVLRTVDAEERLAGLAGGDARAFVVSEARLRASAQSARIALGAKLWTSPRWTAGVTLTTPSLTFWRDASFESTVIDARDGAPVYDSSRVSAQGFHLESQLPGELRLGVAFNEPGSFTVSADVVGALPTSYEIVDAADLGDAGVVAQRVPVPLDVARGAVANVAVGVEKIVGDGFGVAVGAFTNFTSAPELVVRGGFLAPESSRLSRVHMVGGSFALAFYGEHGVARLGVTGSTGAGQIVVPSAPDERFGAGAPPLRVVDATQSFLYVFWSSTVRIGDVGPVRPDAL